ncbi:MAG: tetratricopeptide repeat protein [Bacteroidetes bacterium]|nr:tetratricopeptide repeat protein [Bacteroidota bacterium]
MNNNEDFDLDEKEFAASVKKCDTMLATGKEVYFDVDEFIDLVDYYSEIDEEDKIQKLFMYAEKQHGFNSDIESAKAMFLLDCEREDEALQKFQKLFELEPDSAFHAADLSFVYAHKGDIANALFYLKRAIALEPEAEEETVCYVCAELFAHAHYETAQKILEQTLKNYPENEELAYKLALCYNMTDNTGKSIQLLKTVLETEPYSFDAWFNLGVAHWQDEQFDEAIEALDYALAINTDFIEAYFVKAACLVQLENTPAAIEVFKEILQRDPEHEGALESLADCYTELEDFEQAANCLITLLEIEPDHAKAWAKLARFYALDANYKGAIELFQKALELEPGNCDIIMDFATLLSALDMNDMAIALCKQAVKLDEYNIDVWLKYCNILRNNGKIVQAIKILQKALTYVQEASLYYTLAELFVEQKNFDKAVEYFKLAYEDVPEVAECFFDNCTIPTDKLELFHSIVHK